MAPYPLGRWLLTVETARAAAPVLWTQGGWIRRAVELWAAGALTATPLAAVLWKGRVVRRSSWSREEQLSPRDHARLAAAAISTEGFVSRSGTRLLSKAVAVRCTSCPVRAGEGPCVHCTGTGAVGTYSADGAPTLARCRHCRDGFARCEVCAGTGTAYQTKVGYFEDRVAPVAGLALPELPASLDAWLTEQLTCVSAPPEVLAVALERAQPDGPYRAAHTAYEPDFHGYHLGSRIEAARRHIAESVGTADVVKSEARAYAWPLVHLRFQVGAARYEAVAVVDASGTARVQLGTDAAP